MYRHKCKKKFGYREKEKVPLPTWCDVYLGADHYQSDGVGEEGGVNTKQIHARSSD